VENMWKTVPAVEKTDRNIFFPQFPQVKFLSACGKVENFV
jgi:hypothetical protein